MKKVTEHKHLDMVLDSRLSFSAYSKYVFSQTRRGIGLLKCLCKYLPRHTLNEFYELYVQPRLDYWDVSLHADFGSTGEERKKETTFHFPLLPSGPKSCAQATGMLIVIFHLMFVDLVKA